MSNRTRYIKALLDDPARFDVQEAEILLKKIKEKYHGKTLMRRIGCRVFATSGTRFFEKYYGELWRKMLQLKKKMEKDT